jgi:hypothetical protein
MEVGVYCCGGLVVLTFHPLRPKYLYTFVCSLNNWDVHLGDLRPYEYQGKVLDPVVVT